MHLLANHGKCITASCGKDVSKILYEKAVLFNHKGQEYKLITNTLRIRKDTAVKIIQKYINDKKTSSWDVYFGCPRKLEL